jgi:hypothetical protein
MDLIDANINSSVFVGFITGAIFNTYMLHSEGKFTTPGMRYLITKLGHGTLSEFDVTCSSQLADKQFANADKLQSLAEEFLF